MYSLPEWTMQMPSGLAVAVRATTLFTLISESTTLLHFTASATDSVLLLLCSKLAVAFSSDWLSTSTWHPCTVGLDAVAEVLEADQVAKTLQEGDML